MLSVKMIKIPVSSVERVAPFYTDVLGLKQTFVAAEYGWAQFDAGNLPLALYEPQRGGGQGVVGGCDSVHLATADLAPLMARLEAAGVDPEEILHQGNDGTTFLEVTDPDNNMIKVFLQA